MCLPTTVGSKEARRHTVFDLGCCSTNWWSWSSRQVCTRYVFRPAFVRTNSTTSNRTRTKVIRTHASHHRSLLVLPAAPTAAAVPGSVRPDLCFWLFRCFFFPLPLLVFRPASFRLPFTFLRPLLLELRKEDAVGCWRCTFSAVLAEATTVLLP